MGAQAWGVLPWRPIDCSSANLGDFEDAVFFGLEELDGNAYKLTRGEGSYKVEPRSALTEAEPRKKAKREARLDEAGQEVVGEDSPSPDADATGSKKDKKKKDKKNKEKKKKEDKKKMAPTTAAVKAEFDPTAWEDEQWGSVQLHGLLVKSLTQLNFTVPTPIQNAAIPITIGGGCDLVGAAETGSGKTLAFCLPVLNSLLRDWAYCAQQTTPYALIISPTRELTMQIAAVLRELCTELKRAAPACRVEIVAVVGGMSEHKQRRQLSGQAGRPAHVVVATPGRLCEMMADEGVAAFADMSRLRFLVVDEADRIVEEGHFPELQRVFGRIRDHEAIAARGQVPSVVYASRKQGTFDADFGGPEAAAAAAAAVAADDGGDAGRKRKQPREVRLAFARMPTAAEMAEYRRRAKELGKASLTAADLDEAGAGAGGGDGEGEEGDDDYADGGEGDEDEEIEFEFEPMPTEEQLAEARRTTPAIPLDELPADDEEEEEEGCEGEERGLAASGPLWKPDRQTLLFSATALKAQLRVEAASKKQRKALRGLTGDRVRELPLHLQQLLATVAAERQRDVRVVDVTGVGIATAEAESQEAAHTGKPTKGAQTGKTAATAAAAAAPAGLSLPKGLTQQQVLMPAEDKDAMAYHVLLRQGGRALVFVNSIKTARRVDGLLRALGLNCRTIHAQLQQKQRLKALESFRAAPVGVLVATDVAARGLDIPKVTTVLHYDVARSPQVYVHRSGRTARANTTGTTVSLVAPEDLAHHNAVCALLGLAALPNFVPDLTEVGLLRERVSLAKKIFTQSFVASQKVKDSAWLEQSAAEAGLEIDDYMLEEEGSREKQQEQTKQRKKQLERARGQLKQMLDAPVALASRGIGSSKRGFVVFAK